jgi:hypothetical protein
MGAMNIDAVWEYAKVAARLLQSGVAVIQGFE